MTRTYLMLAALGLATAACDGGGTADKTAATGEAGTAGQAAGTETADAPVETPNLLSGQPDAEGVVAGGAVDVLRREGWRVEGQPAAAQPAPTATETTR
jgi:hypothetical protein